MDMTKSKKSVSQQQMLEGFAWTLFTIPKMFCFVFFACTYTIVYWESSGSGPNTKGWSSQEKPNIHPFRTPQVKASHQCICIDSQANFNDAHSQTNEELCKKNRFAALWKSQEVRSVTNV